MIRPLKYILLIAFVYSCKNNSVDKPKKPDNLISKDSMVEILYDVSLISSAKGINRKLLEIEGIVPEDYIYSKHNIDSLRFALSNEYYAHDLKTYEDIYNGVKAKLEKDKTHFQAIIDAEQKVKDSLKTIKKKQDSLKRIGKPKKYNKLKRNSIFPRPTRKIDTSEILIFL